MKADLVLKVYALLMRHVLPLCNANSGENEEVPSPQDQEQGQDDATSNTKRPLEGFQLLDGQVIFGICRR